MLDEIIEKLEVWENLNSDYIADREAYRLRWAQVYLEKEAVKPDTALKAAADVETTGLRTRRDKAEAAAAAAWQKYIVARGQIEGAKQPCTWAT